MSRPEPQTADVAELLEQRAQLQDWLARLDEVQQDADARIVERIREDYRERLRSVLDALAGHLDSLRSDRAARQRALEAAEHERQGARDALEEARLRHRIGELPEAGWQERRVALEAELGRAERECESIGGEVARLAEILEQVEGGLAAPAAAPRPAPEPTAAASTPEPDPDDQSLSPTIRMDMAEIAMITASLAPQPEADADEEEPAHPAPAAEQDPEGGDLAFLEELDRAIEASLSAGGGRAAGQGVTADDTPQKRAGAKCPECGYTNDPEAWYCGVCGVDLA